MLYEKVEKKVRDRLDKSMTQIVRKQTAIALTSVSKAVTKAIGDDSSPAVHDALVQFQLKCIEGAKKEIKQIVRREREKPVELQKPEIFMWAAEQQVKLAATLGAELRKLSEGRHVMKHGKLSKNLNITAVAQKESLKRFLKEPEENIVKGEMVEDSCEDTDKT